MEPITRLPSPMKIIAVFLAVLAPLLLFALDIQHDDGIVGATPKNGFGCVCHNGASNPGVTVWITGPSMVEPGSTNSFVVHMSGGPAVTGGFNVASAGGSLISSDGETQVITGELTHVSPKSFSGGSVAWNFQFQAPLSEGFDTLYSVGLSTNNNLTPDGADEWNYGSNVVVTVSSTPPGPVPILTDWGFGILAILFAAGGSWLLSRRIPAARS